MVENDFQRRKREHEFQVALLNAQGKKESGRFVSIINSGAFLWLATLVVATIGGAALSERQQCFRDAQTQIELFDKLESEINHRDAQIRKMVAEAKTLNDLRNSLDDITHYAPEFATHTTRFVRSQYLSLRRRIAPELGQRTSLVDQPLNFRFEQIRFGEVPEYIKDEDLAELRKYFAPRWKFVSSALKSVGMSTDMLPLALTFAGAPQLEPSCGPLTLLRRFYHGGYYVRVVKPARYTSGFAMYDLLKKGN